jgi:hypothetical protein
LSRRTPFRILQRLIPVFLMVVSGCGGPNGGGEPPAAETTLPAGLYDFYGTFSDHPVYADGSERCAIPEPLACPSVTHFCIYGLEVEATDSSGVQPIHGCSERPEDAFYDPVCETDSWNVAVGKVYMLPFILSDWDGGGQVVGGFDPGGGRLDARSETSMVVEKRPGLLPSWRIASWSTSLEDSPDTSPGTLVLTIPYRNNLKPPPPQDAPPGTYSPPASTSHRATCRVTNPEAGTSILEAGGTPLSGMRCRLVTPHSILRTVVGGIVMGSDVLSITTWDGTFCRRTNPDRTCIRADFVCPELDD